MPTLDVVTTENKKAGKLDVSPVVFEAVVKPHLLHAEVRRQRHQAVDVLARDDRGGRGERVDVALQEGDVAEERPLRGQGNLAGELEPVDPAVAEIGLRDLELAVGIRRAGRNPHDAVADVGVIGVPDTEGDRGMLVKACIVRSSDSSHSGISDNDLTEMLKRHVADRIGLYKQPRLIEFVGSLPTTSSGKIARAELRRQHAE